jgi:hypothetical protein
VNKWSFEKGKECLQYKPVLEKKKIQLFNDQEPQTRASSFKVLQLAFTK